MFAALRGELVARSPRSAADAYSLFVARSSAHGWLTRLWGMNDAGLAPGLAWFQVAVTQPVTPLPVQPFLACARDVIDRLGTLRLDVLQLLLPVQALDASGLSALSQDANWFAECDPHARAPVRVTLDGGQDATIRSAAPEMFEWMRRMRQGVFRCEAVSLADDDVALPTAPVGDELWLGPPQHRVTFSGPLAEWSLDALGWLAALLADVSHRHGVSTPLLLTSRRA